jgi:hypothetical protein
MRISLKAINSELERLGSHAVLAKGDGCFYFWGGEATDWLDLTVRVTHAPQPHFGAVDRVVVLRQK